MRPTQLTGILMLCILICFGYAWLMNAAGAVGAGLGILVILGVRANLFHSGMKDLMTSLTVTRSVDKEILHQNSIIKVTSSITAVVKHMTASFEDVIPTGAVLVSGRTGFTNGETAYSINLPVIGESYFKGVRVTCSDLFFTRTILFARNAELPKLIMYPTGIGATYQLTGRRAGWSSIELDRPARIAGIDTRMFRPYTEGDNIRNIDWKLTSKHMNLYVRLKMDASGGRPALIVDLPQIGVSKNICMTFAETVAGCLGSNDFGDDSRIVFISGAMYLGMVRSGSIEEILAMLKRAGNIYPTDHLFRLSHPESIMNMISGHDKNQNAWSAGIRKLMQRNAGRYPSVFENTVHNIANLLDEEKQIIYITTASGDVSHMTYYLTEMRKYECIETVLVVGSTDRKKDVRDIFTRAGADVVEMIA